MDGIPSINVVNFEENGKNNHFDNGNNAGIPRDVLDRLNQASGPNQSIINQMNQSTSVKRPGIQKPAVERAQRSLFLFTLDSKFRKW